MAAQKVFSTVKAVLKVAEMAEEWEDQMVSQKASTTVKAFEKVAQMAA